MCGLEAEEGLHEDVSVAWCGHAEGTGGEGLGLAEEWGVENAVGCAAVGDVEEVECADDEGEVVAARHSGVELDLLLTAAEASALNATTTLHLRAAGFSFDAWTDADGLADANVEDDVGGAGAEVVGDELLVLAGGVGVETAEGGGDDTGGAAGAVSGTGKIGRAHV